jgi:tetratricopeptide (TPR) repeat protein
MDTALIEQLTASAHPHKGLLPPDRLRLVSGVQQEYLARWAVLNEPISPADIGTFLQISGSSLSEEELLDFLQTSLSGGVITASIVEGKPVPLFIVESGIRRLCLIDLTPTEVRERHTWADQFYRRVFGTLLKEMRQASESPSAVPPESDGELMALLVGPEGLIDFGAHHPEIPALYNWTISRAFFWQHHLLALSQFETATAIANTICFALARHGQRQQAKDMLARCIAAARGGQRTAALANLATLFREDQEHGQALRLYWRCLGPMLRARASAQLAGVLSEMSNIYRDRGRLGRALLLQHGSRLIRYRLHDLRGQAICNNQLSILYRSLRLYGPALRCSLAAENFWRAVHDEVNLAKTLLTQGNILNMLRYPHRALGCFQESLAINNRIGSLAEAASCTSGKARAYLQLDDFQQAKALLQEAIALRERSRDRRIGIEYQNMAMLYEIQGNLIVALGWYEQALPQLEKYLPGHAPGCRRKIASIQQRLRRRS